MTGQLPRAARRSALPLDALAGADGTQDPPPPEPFRDAVAGLITGELMPEMPGAPLVGVQHPPALPTLDPAAVERAAAQLAAEHSTRRRTGSRAGPRSPGPVRQRTSAPAGQPKAYPQAADRNPTGPPRKRSSTGGWLVALIVFGLLGFNLLRALVEYLSRLFH